MRLEMCFTVGQLIEELKKFPAEEALMYQMRPVHYNSAVEAELLGLPRCVGFDDE